MTELDLFGNYTNNTDNNENDASQQDITEIARRFTGQWLFAVATRDAFSIAYKRFITYPQAFAIADKYAPQILGRNILLFAPDESEETLYYREKAALVTAKLRRETGSTEQYTPIEAIDKDITELENLNTNNVPGLTNKRLKGLYKVREELEKTEASHRREIEVLLHDWNRELSDLPAIFQEGGASDYHDFALPGERVMRVRLTHEKKAEDITGVDLIYEYHRPQDQIARLAVVQYKLPKKEEKNIIIDKDKMQSQLNNMHTAFCHNELCIGPSYHDKPSTDRPYQLPNCCAFFRPTNRSQSFNSRNATSGHYIRICDIDRICEPTREGNKKITPNMSMKHGISYKIFEELFNTERLGSRWLTYEQLQQFHQHYKVIKPFEHAGIYIQETPEPTPATLF